MKERTVDAVRTHVAESATDFEAIEQGKVSAPPLHRDLTQHAVSNHFREPKIEL